MEANGDIEREVRAGRNQSLFRAVNEKIAGLNEAFVAAAETFVIACECADVGCIETVQIRPEEYEAVRASPRQFAVRPGHVYADVEVVVREGDGYSVVEKLAAAAEVAEKTAATD